MMQFITNHKDQNKTSKAVLVGQQGQNDKNIDKCSLG